MTPTEKYIHRLDAMKSGERGLLRTHAGQGLDESTEAFDLFTGLWWPLRKKNQRAPKREVAWLIAKLYAACPLDPRAGQENTIACQLRRCQPSKEEAKKRFQDKFDRMLMLPLGEMEFALRWALDTVRSKYKDNATVDWVKLTDDLSIWDRESTRQRWAEEFLNHNEGRSSC
jgi:CRISPR type I-E-associated protein CasB/Cse2